MGLRLAVVLRGAQGSRQVTWLAMSCSLFCVTCPYGTL